MLQTRQGRLVLLGAGASVDAGLLTSFDLTRKLVEAFDDPHLEYRRMPQALHFVCGALLAYDAAAGSSPYAGLDIERVVSAVQLLAERGTLEVTPFVGSWHPAVDQWDKPKAPAFFDDQFRRAVLDTRFRSGTEIYKKIKSVGAIESTGDTYRELAQEMVGKLGDLLVIKPGASDYLRPLVGASNQNEPTVIATLNYDLSVEQAAEAASIEIGTGIESWSSHRKLTPPERGVWLLKLHGSIDWRWASFQRVDGHMPRRTVVPIEPGSSTAEPAILFGHRGKLQASGPFLALLAAFERALDSARELVVVGYSFRDEHINEAIRQWTGENGARRITIVDPAFPEAFGYDERDFRSELMYNLNPSGHQRGQWKPRVRVIREGARAGLARLFADP